MTVFGHCPHPLEIEMAQTGRHFTAGSPILEGTEFF
jgi:hypothetical protein